MSDGLHPVVELLLARMKSNPEEFTSANDHEDRWGYAIETIEGYGSAEDKAALVEGLRSIRLNEAHRWAMDDLLNGEERRERERGESLKNQNAQINLQQYAQAKPMTFSTNSTHPANIIQLGQETLSESVFGQIKSKLGL